MGNAYYAPVLVIRQLKLVYHVTLGTNSWGITLPILSRTRLQGGLVKVWKVVSCFGHFSGLKINLNETAPMFRHCGGQEWAKCFGDMGVEVRNFVKYLGGRLGNHRQH